MEDMQAALYRLDARALAVEVLLGSLLRVLAERSPTGLEITAAALERTKRTMQELAARSQGNTASEVQFARIDKIIGDIERGLNLSEIRHP